MVFVDKYFLFRKSPELKRFTSIFFLALLPVIITTVLFQFFLNNYQILEELEYAFEITSTYNIKTLLLYLATATAHIILSISAIFYFNKKAYRGLKKQKKIRLKFGFVIYTFIILFLFFFVDYLDLNLALLSHERVYVILKESDYFSIFFQSFPNTFFLNIDFKFFYLFSLLPFFLILCGILTIVSSSQYLGRLVADFEQLRISYNLQNYKEELTELLQSFQNCITLLSIVLVTSTIGVSLFLHLPVPLLEDVNIQNEYKSISSSLSFTWGVIFSLTLLIMSIIPLILILNRIRLFSKRKKINGDEKFVKWIRENRELFLISNNLQTLFSVLSPTIMGILLQIVGL